MSEPVEPVAPVVVERERGRGQLNRSLAVGLLILSYVLLVGIVATGAFYIQHEFEDANHDRCDILRVQVDLLRLQSKLLGDGPPDITPEVNQLLIEAKDDADRVCPPE